MEPATQEPAEKKVDAPPTTEAPAADPFADGTAKRKRPKNRPTLPLPTPSAVAIRKRKTPRSRPTRVPIPSSNG